MIEIDGSYGEGGGQILRMSVALSALTGTPVTITHIRAGRPTPGLRPQHLAAVEAVRALCKGTVKGLRQGSTTIEFSPGDITGGTYAFDVGTAGSITLVFQACLLPSLFADRPTTITVRGGTDVRWSPPWDYFAQVFVPLLRRMGLTVEAHLQSRGYYPRGGGEATATVHPEQHLRPLSFSDASSWQVAGIVHLARLPSHVAQRMQRAAQEKLRPHSIQPLISIKQSPAPSPGVGITLWSKTPRILGGDALGEKGVPAEAVGRQAAQALLQEITSGAELDVHAVDHLLPYLALLSEPSSFTCRELSRHAETELWLLERFLGIGYQKKQRHGLTEVTIQP